MKTVSKACGNAFKERYVWVCEVCGDVKFNTEEACIEHEKTCRSSTSPNEPKTINHKISKG